MTAISGAVNIASGLFKKANDPKCCGLVLFFFPSSFLSRLNCLQEAGLPEHHKVLTHCLLNNSLSVLSRAGLANDRQQRHKDAEVES